MGSQNGLDQIVLFALAQRISLGLAQSLTLIIFTHGQNAPTRVSVIARLVIANVLLAMKVLLAKEPFALITVMIVALAGQRSTWRPRSREHTLLLGMR
jgi:hypothetical protein